MSAPPSPTATHSLPASPEPVDTAVLNPFPLRMMELDADAANIFQGYSLEGAAPDDVPKLLRTALKGKMARVIDAFRQLDDDGSGRLDGPEFGKGLKEMGLDAPDEAIGAIFDSFDADGSGLISYTEMDKLVTRSARTHPKLPPLALKAANPIALRKGQVSKKNASLLQNLDLADAPPEALPALVRNAMGEKLLRVIDVFRQLDDDDSGMIDGPEFAKGLREMGCDAAPEVVGAIFASLDPDGNCLLEYDELHEVLVRSVQEAPDLPPLELTAKNPIALRTAPLSKKDANLLQGAVDLENASPEELPKLIRDALNKKLTRVIDLFRQIDDDASGTIDGAEFAKGLREMGLNAPPTVIGAIFSSFDEDGGAFIEYDELHDLIIRSAQKHPNLPPLPLEAKNPIAIRRAKIKKEDANLLQSLDIDEDHLEELPGQLKGALKRESVRVLDLFRQFDDDASGSISRPEFRKAMGELGLKIGALGIKTAAERTKAVVCDLFKMFNADGGKYIEYDELQKQLRGASAFVSAEQQEELDEREADRLRPMTAVEDRAKAELDARAGTADPTVGRRLSGAPSVAPAPAAPPPEPVYVPNYLEPLKFDPVAIGAYGGFLFMHDAKGTARASEKLALVMHPIPKKKSGSKAAAKTPSTLHGRVAALPLHRLLADEGWSILYVEPHALGARSGGAVDEADAKLRAAMKYITAHRSLRYCKMIMLTQGPATSAALCAMGDEPKLFEYRVRAISACQPTPLKALSVVGRRGGGVPLEAGVASVTIPAFVSHAVGSALNESVAHKTVTALKEVGTPTACIGVETGSGGLELFGKAERFDGARYLGTDDGAQMLLMGFVEQHFGGGARVPRPVPPPEDEVAAEGA